MVGCDDSDEDVKPTINLDFFAGTWEVVEQGDQNVFERETILEIKSARIHEGFGGYQGYITTYFLTDLGIPKHDKVFTWTINYVENNQPLLDVVYQGDLDSDDIWAGEYPYKIIELTGNDMCWQVNTKGDKSIIKFRRRTDLNIE